MHFNVTVLAGDAAELSRIAEELRAVRIDDLLYVGGKTGCGSFRLRSEAYSPASNHLLGVSSAFSAAVFLVEAYDMESWTDKMVFCGGQLLRKANDDSRTQGGIWALPNIFEPYRVEYELGLPVSSLWDEWVADVVKAAHQLRVPAAYATEAPEILDLTFADELPGVVKEPKPGEATTLVQKQRRDGVWRTLCNMCHQPIRASVEGFQENGDEDFGYDPDRLVCFEVTPCNVTIESCMFCLGMGAEECWRKKKPGTFVVCTECFAKLGVVPTQLALTPPSADRYFQNGDVVPSAVVEPEPDESALVVPDGLGDLEDIEALE